MSKTVYVTKAGNDSNDGLTVPTAKLTIGGANAIAVSGDTVNIGAGVWTETGTLCGVSNVSYVGAGMFLTTYVGYLAGGTASWIHLLQGLKITWTSGFAGNYNNSGGYMNCANVYHDFSAVAASSIAASFCVMRAGIRMRNCIFKDYACFTSPFFGDSGTAHTLTLYNCVFSHSVLSAVPMLYSAGTLSYTSIRNNIFINCRVGASALVQCYFDPANANRIHYNNCYYNMTAGGGIGINSYLSTGEFIADPLFVDPAGGDFRLQDSSPCIGKGTPNLP